MLPSDVSAVYAGQRPASSIMYAGEQIWPALWTPASITGLGLWFDAGQLAGLTDGAPVTAWPDLSGHGHTAAAAAATPPVYRDAAMNGYPAVEFTGTDTTAQSMRVADWGTALSGSTEYTLYIVARQRSYGIPVITAAPYGQNGWLWLTEYDTAGGAYWGHGGYRNYHDSIPMLVAHILCFQFPPADPHFYVNDTEITDWTVYGGDIQAAVPNLGPDVQLGGYWTDQYGVDGWISEVIWYDRALSDTERDQVQSYLETKWDIAAGVALSQPVELPAFGPTPLPPAVR